MNGRLGAIYINGRQVGGFLDWSVKLNLAEGVEDGDKTRKLQSWKVTAWAHWLFRELAPATRVQLKLCANEGPGYWEGTGKVASQPTGTLGTLIHAQFEVTGTGELEGKKVTHEK